MQRRASKRKIKEHPPSKAQPANHCRALMLADGAAIRKKIKQDYEKALRDLDQSRQQLDQFHQTDLPQFTRWLNAQFGALLTELRELSQKIAADEELVDAVEFEVRFGGDSYARAYRRVMKLRENPEPSAPPPNPGGEPNEDWDPFDAQPGSSNADRDTDPTDDFFDAIFGESGPRPRGNPHGGAPGELFPRPRSQPPASRLKELYRALVRRLHPDTQQQMTPQKTEWWHQAQAAYEAGDEGQLEIILTLCEIGETGTTAHTSASLLQRITAQLKSSLREIKRQLAERRSDPAWGFSRQSDHSLLAVRLRNAMMSDLAKMRELWRETQEMIAEWKAAAERLRPPRGRKRRQPDVEFPF